MDPPANHQPDNGTFCISAEEWKNCMMFQIKKEKNQPLQPTKLTLIYFLFYIWACIDLSYVYGLNLIKFAVKTEKRGWLHIWTQQIMTVCTMHCTDCEVAFQCHLYSYSALSPPSTHRLFQPPHRGCFYLLNNNSTDRVQRPYCAEAVNFNCFLYKKFRISSRI